MPQKMNTAAPLGTTDLDPLALPGILEADTVRKAASRRVADAKEELKAAKEELDDAQARVFQLIQDARPTALELAAGGEE